MADLFINIGEINSSDRNEKMSQALDIIFSDVPQDIEISNPLEEVLHNISSVDFIKKLMDNIRSSFTIVIENNYVDKAYRDSYYMYFSNQHFQIERYCKRITFLKGCYDYLSFFEKGLNNSEKLSEDALSSCVILPLNGGIIGRSLVSPSIVLKENSAFLRTSDFCIHLFGIPVKINAFPYYMQDRETMRCSEITLLCLLEYYSNTYMDYRSVMPSDIVYYKEKHIHERALPSKGITYHTLTKILSEFGFSPRLYNIEAMERQNYSGMTEEDDIKRIMHYYIESGIPVAVNVGPVQQTKSGHSLICVGHSSKKNEKKAIERKKYISLDQDNEYSIINSADYYDEYVVMDDNQFPYQIRNYSNLSIYSDMRIINLSVPLYKRMFLEATDAYDIFIEILESNHWGVVRWSGDCLKDCSDIVTRVFLASSRSYKEFRVKSNKDTSKGWMLYYGNLSLPRFIWVCELYTLDGYEKSKPFGEIVLDATSASRRGIENVILMNYPDRLYARNPDQSSKEIENNSFMPSEKCNLEAYNRNLFPVKKLD